MSAARDTDVTELLREFYSHSDRHPNGWGLAIRRNGSMEITKEPVRASRSERLGTLLASGVRTDVLLAHIRYATVGGEAYENSHPFTAKDNSGRMWTLIHNGTIFGYSHLGPYQYTQCGRTDSERILLYIIKTINEEITDPDAEARFRILDRILCEITSGNKVNLLIYDGELLYVHTNYRSSLHQRKEGGGMLFSTRPLGRKEWEPLPMNTLLVFRKGKQEFTGTDHGNEFIDNASKTRHLYLDYAAL